MYIIRERRKYLKLRKHVMTNYRLSKSKLRKYDILTKDLGHIYKGSDKVISYVVIENKTLMRYHRKHISYFEILPL